MQSFKKQWFKPDYQVEGQPVVEFELQQLDQRTFYAMQCDMGDRGVGPDGAFACFEYSVVGWKGLDVEFSTPARRAVLNGLADKRWMVWIAQISAEQYRKALLGDESAKN